MQANGEQPRRIAEGGEGGRFLQLQWSPDGKRIAFMKSQGAEGKQQVTIESQAVETEERTLMLADPLLQSFCWTTDGRLLVSLQQPARSASDTNLWQLRVAADGRPQGKPQKITNRSGFSFWDLSLTADGKRLAFVKSGSQGDVYVGQLDRRTLQLQEPRRLTLDDHNDWPGAWSEDGKQVLFFSDRNGNFDILRQAPGGGLAEEVVGGPDDKTEAQLNSAGALLYWDSERDGDRMRLMAAKANGAAPVKILEALRGAAFRCAQNKNRCLLSEPTREKQVVFSKFDLEGNHQEILRMPATTENMPAWALAADGSWIAVANIGEAGTQLRTQELSSGNSHEFIIKGRTVTGITAWGTGWLLTSASLRGNELLYLNEKGETRELWKSSSVLSRPVVSPDGSRVAIGVSSQDSNVWVLENF